MSYDVNYYNKILYIIISVQGAPDLLYPNGHCLVVGSEKRFKIRNSENYVAVGHLRGVYSFFYLVEDRLFFRDAVVVEEGFGIYEFHESPELFLAFLFDASVLNFIVFYYIFPSLFSE